MTNDTVGASLRLRRPLGEFDGTQLRSQAAARLRGVLTTCLIIGLSTCGTFLSGCAAMRPLHGVPARYLPDEYRKPPTDDKVAINPSLLRQKPVNEHRVDAGDVLAVYIDGWLGNNEVQPPPVNLPSNEDDTPSVGYPIPIRPDGTIALPGLPPIDVRGMTLAEVEDRIRKAFTEQEFPILQEGRDRIMVSLQRPRRHRILVIRQEVGNDFTQSGPALSFNPGNWGNLGQSKRGNGRVVRLPAYKNDVLHALTETGGMPGLDAANFVYVIRNHQAETAVANPAPWGNTVMGDLPANFNENFGHCPTPIYLADATIEGPHVLKIPLRLTHGEVPSFSEADITLHDGDVLYVETREREIYFTGGLLGGGQYTLPRDYDRDVLEAISIAQAGGNVSNNGRSIAGVAALNRDVTVAASRVIVLRQLPDGREVPIEIDLYEAIRNPAERILIQPGDYIMLQYTKAEACAAFFERYIIEPATLGLAGGFLINN